VKAALGEELRPGALRGRRAAHGRAGRAADFEEIPDPAGYDRIWPTRSGGVAAPMEQKWRAEAAHFLLQIRQVILDDVPNQHEIQLLQ